MRAIPALLAVAATLVAREATAEDLRLSWHAPPGCPTERQVRDAALRTVPSEAPREHLDAEVEVERGERWTVTIRTKRAGIAAAERRLDATSCEALADATAVILALALVPSQPDESPPIGAPGSAQGPGEVAGPPSPSTAAAAAADPGAAPVAASAPTPTPIAAAAPAGAAPDAVDRAAPSREPYAHALAAGASLATDGTTLPGPALGVRASVGWTPSRARLELAGAAYADQSKTTGISAAGATFTLLVAGARGCWAIVRDAVELSPCAGADVQIVKAHGYGASANYDASAAWLSATGGALVRVPVTRWLALRGDVDAVVPLSRPTFVVEGDGAVHRPKALGVRAGIGAELLFL